MEKIYWTAYCHEERHSAINNIQGVILKYGDIIDFKFFSDISLTMIIEIKECNIDKLYEALKNNLGIDKHAYLHSNSHQERVIYLNITFSASTGNLMVEVPSVPG